MVEEDEQNFMNVLLVITMGKKDMLKEIVGNCIVNPHHMNMQLQLRT